MSDSYDPVLLPVIQPGPGIGGLVTRQKGLPPNAVPSIDPQPLPAIVQVSDEFVVSRNPGNGAQQFAADGTLFSDSPARDGVTFYAEVLATGEQPMPPPGLARTTAPLPPPSEFGEMTAVQQREAVKAAAIAAGFIVSDGPVEAKDSPTTFAVMASDEGSTDPRDKSAGPQVISKLPVIKKAPIVPVDVSNPVAKKSPKKGKK